jgi:hypothetical protein
MYVIFQKTSSPQTQVTLHELVPDRRENLVNYSLRNDNDVNLIEYKINRFQNSFLPSSTLA